MIIICVTAVFAIAAGIGVSFLMASKSPEKVIWHPINRSVLAQEQTVLAKAIIDSLNQIKKAPADSDVISKAISAYKKIAHQSWDLESHSMKYSYMGEKFPPFLRTLDSSFNLHNGNYNREYVSFLVEMIEQTIPLCSQAVISGDTGTDFSTLSHNMDKVLSSLKTKLTRLNDNQLKMKSDNIHGDW